MDIEHHEVYRVGYMENWSDASKDSDSFVQYLDNLDWLVIVELLPGKAMQVFSSNVYEMQGLLQKTSHCE